MDRTLFEVPKDSGTYADTLKAVGLAQWSIEHSEYAPRPEDRMIRFLRTIRPKQRRFRDLLAGVQLAYFKSLGTGKALSSVSTILLPDWLPVSEQTYQVWRSLLAEHKRVLKTLDEQKGEEAN